MDDIEDIMRMDKEKLAAPIKTIEVQSYSVIIFLGKLFLALAYNMYNNCINDNKTRFSNMACVCTVLSLLAGSKSLWTS